MENLYRHSLISKVKGNYAELKQECQDMGLEEVYQNYVAKINRNYISTLIIMHIVIAVVHSIVTYRHQTGEEGVVYDVYIYLIGAAHTLRPCYAGYVISIVYLFMPLPGFLHPIFLGCFISLLYAADFVIVTKSAAGSRAFDFDLLAPDILFLVGLNMIGIFNRWRHEMITRIVFLTRRQTMEQSLVWKYAKDQEKSLLISIIPEPIAKKIGQEIKYRIEKSKIGALTEEGGRKLFIESHEDVSILFADLVNFTFLTTQLDVKSLVNILHDLFQRFDKACNEFNVMRIKFLGDCYYGVSGVPVSHPLHSVCCIELGRSIIQNIREVRAIKNLNIDMRIGIHSGSLLAGIIGSSKWQYDIWSKDVNIANRLESTGLPGRIHISNATLTLADGFYIYEEGTERAKTDLTLSKHNIKTFLIIEPSAKMGSSPEWLNYLQSKKEADASLYNVEMQDANLGEGYQCDYQDIVDKARELMEQEVENLPVCKLECYGRCFTRQRRLSVDEIEEYRAKSSISSICLIFGDWSWELKYLAYRAEEFYKFPVLVSFLILICIIGMQAANKYIQNILEFWIISGFMVTILTIPLVLVWHKNIISIIAIKKIRATFDDVNAAKQAKCGQENRYSFPIIFNGNDSDFSRVLRSFVLENDDEIIFLLLEEGIRTMCFNSWAVTESLCLYIAIALSWPRIPFFLALLLTIPLVIVYIVMIFTEFSLVYEASIPANNGVSAEFAHIWGLLIIFYLHILTARHITFIAKFNYLNREIRWQLQEKIDNSSVTNESIRVLLHNILPSHVVQIYLTKRLQNEPFYEQHEYTAVMFATVIHRRVDAMDLGLMNEIICDFDEILSFYKHPIKVEKIKVINWTYMAACGLSTKRSYLRDSIQSIKSVFVPNRYPRISSGEVMAGVVGLSQAHYDIWGNAVNMAARMDTTGEPGRIQVTEETAEVLRSYNIESTYRGLTEVKGRGKIPTYFINIDEKLNFQGK
uniref:adenylate cyclase n=1 Tax=Glossina brevipalpis TaxID=37001 RepID=A0A1A9X0W8_9MUSC